MLKKNAQPQDKMFCRLFKRQGYYYLGSLLVFLLISVAGISQSRMIAGQVMDEHGVPIASASVKIAGSPGGSVTDDLGKFELKLSPPATLIVSSLGYVTQEIKVTDQSELEIHLKANDDNKLGEVIVVGYGTQKKTDVTGAVTSVSADRLSKIPVTNVMQSVEGAVPGLTVTSTSGVPGSSPSLLVRGQNSITAGSGPYIIVDGIPLIKTVGSSLNDINPNDIESIVVLKDASATAIYGTQGSNGVILVTTKRGKTGKPQIRYNGYTGIENIAHVLQPRDGASYVQKYADYMTATGQTQTSPVPNYGELDNYNNGTTTDWIKEATRTGILQDHNLSVSGGTDNVRYYFGGEYLKQKGVVEGYQYHRASFRSNLDVKITDFLKVGTSSFFTANDYGGGRANLLNATAMSPYGNEYNDDGSYAIFPMYPELLYTNPLVGLTTSNMSKTVNINANAYAEVDLGGLLKGLRYRLNAGYIYFPERYATYTGRAANDMLGTASVTNAHTSNYTIENLLYYNADFGKNHLDFTGLYSAQQRKYMTTTAGAKGFVNDVLTYNNLGAGATQTSSSYSDKYGLNSQMVRVNYNYDSRYLLTLTARRDGSSVFGANTSKYGIFPSAAFGWNISNESFMKSVDFVNNLKLRVSYGKTGNEAVGVYKTITTDNSIRQPFDGISTIGVVAGNLGNDNLHWESTKTFNLGLDFSLFNHRVDGTIDYYNNKTYGLLLSRSLPIITGYSSVLDNIGKTSNNGLEISLNTKNVELEKFGWETSLSFSTNKNKIVDLYGDGKDDLGNRWFIGHPIGVIYDYKLEGVWQEGEDPSNQDPGAKPGDLKFADLNGDHQITAEDKSILGQTTPKWTGGMTNTFHYGNFSLRVFIQTVQGVLKNNPDLNYADETGRRNTPEEVGYWTPENKSNTRPSLAYNNTRGYGYPSNASYTRLKDVTLSYVFSQSLLDKWNLGGLTFYVSGRNLITNTDWIGWDPESNYSTRGSGDWVNNYPVTRSFVFGMNISLK
ncbi:TonB-linked outer membrane protein, SusC/RagA family [Arachidicoccus rhizosphaerae]|uniref:TonB-linked outer membrane protein, SusC/RagA family n=1 Tax=Arachidicoccus rhizosphaerae TaxID=551991 RepID=A0A1H3Y5S4_9BACT|nr:TonB-dependent receptor [Arachidicoccus rhizosphaerae]SEA07005.1 TonB-linked outer membrane protein, SusC/RagA family [Arachidicoccus rhizosphaerae]